MELIDVEKNPEQGHFQIQNNYIHQHQQPYFLVPPIANPSYVRNLADNDDQSIKTLTNQYEIFLKRGPMQLQKIQHGRKFEQGTTKKELKILADAIFSKMMESIKCLSGEIKQNDINLLVNKIDLKVREFYKLTKQIKVQEVRASICSIIQEQTEKIQNETNTINDTIKQIEQFLDCNKEQDVERDYQNSNESNSNDLFMSINQ